MLKCKNDPTRNYKGTEPSPKGLGFCAHAETIGEKRKGKDGNDWIVKETKNGIKRWIKIKEEKNLNKLKLEDFFQLTVIPPKKINKYLIINPILKKIIDVIIPKVKKNKINFYFIPLVLSDNGIYWTDYAHSYLNEFYGKKYLDSNFIQLTVYMNNNLKLNYDRDILIDYQLSLDQQQIIYDIFSEYLPYNYDWDGNQLKVMKISYQKNKKKITKKKIKNTNRYPMTYIKIYVKEEKNLPNFFDVDPRNAKELSILKEIEKKAKLIDIDYGSNDIGLTIYGFNDLKLLKQLVNSIKKSNKLSFEKDLFSLELKKIKALFYKNANDVKVNKFIIL